MRSASGSNRTAGCLVAAALAVFLLVSPARATPQDDYATGLQSYRSGDIVGALPALRRSADAGHAAAQAQLAEILDAAEFDEQAVVYYRKSAAQNHVEGQFGLGSMYAKGEGVERDPQQARLWLARAAEQGHAQAINVLAHAYMNGGLGVSDEERSSEAALAWLKRAAANNYLPILDYLAASYRSGRFGVVDLQLAGQYEAQSKKLRGVDKRRGKKK